MMFWSQEVVQNSSLFRKKNPHPVTRSTGEDIHLNSFIDVANCFICNSDVCGSIVSSSEANTDRLRQVDLQVVRDLRCGILKMRYVEHDRCIPCKSLPQILASQHQ